MIETQTIWISLHVLLLVYWLGADISVFYSSLQIIKTENSIETRVAIAKVLGFVNWFPSIASILMLPIGFMLATGSGLLQVDGMWLAVPWVLVAIWLLIAVGSNTQRGTNVGRIYGSTDLWIRCLLIVALTFTSTSTMFSDWRFYESNWLALKILIFAYILCCGIGIRFTFAEFGPSFGQLIRQGSTPELEDAIRRPVMMVKPWVIALWAGLLASAFLGIAQPDF